MSLVGSCELSQLSSGTTALGARGFSPPSCLVRLKLGSGFSTAHGWFLPFFGGHVVFLFFGVFFFSLSLCVLPRKAKICLAFLRPAR